MNRCPECLLRECLCGELPRIANSTEIVILRHYAEEGRASNSGRLAAMALERCRLIRYGRQGEAVPAIGDDAALLFPEPAAPPLRRPARIVVLDASWSQARKMRQRLPALRGMPILALPPAALPAGPLRTLRTPPHPGQLPTVLAIAEALALLEGEVIAAPLRALWSETVARVTRDGRHPGRFIGG